MKEELISFETAKLAKEVGFDENTGEFYTTAGKLTGVMYYDPTPNNKTIDTEWFSVLEKESTAYCTAPTQSLLQRWLREKHKIHIKVDDFINDKLGIEWDFEVTLIGTDIDEGGNYIPLISYSLNDPNRKFNTYELALEAGLLQALKLIKT